ATGITALTGGDTLAVHVDGATTYGNAIWAWGLHGLTAPIVDAAAVWRVATDALGNATQNAPASGLTAMTTQPGDLILGLAGAVWPYAADIEAPTFTADPAGNWDPGLEKVLSSVVPPAAALTYLAGLLGAAEFQVADDTGQFGLSGVLNQPAAG